MIIIVFTDLVAKICNFVSLIDVYTELLHMWAKRVAINMDDVLEKNIFWLPFHI